MKPAAIVLGASGNWYTSSRRYPSLLLRSAEGQGAALHGGNAEMGGKLGMYEHKFLQHCQQMWLEFVQVVER